MAMPSSTILEPITHTVGKLVGLVELAHAEWCGRQQHSVERGPDRLCAAISAVHLTPGSRRDRRRVAGGERGVGAPRVFRVDTPATSADVERLDQDARAGPDSSLDDAKRAREIHAPETADEEDRGGGDRGDSDGRGDEDRGR